jgi:hypothetical protein
LRQKVLLSSTKRPIYRHIVAGENKTIDASATGGDMAGPEVYYKMDRGGGKKPTRLRIKNLEGYGSVY